MPASSYRLEIHEGYVQGWANFHGADMEPLYAFDSIQQAIEDILAGLDSKRGSFTIIDMR